MAVIVGSARGDERGRITGGQAGDQTGREVATETWYSTSGGWRVLRPKSKEVAEKIARNMQAACDNNLIGYDQSQNNTLFLVAQYCNYDCARVDVPCETDCSQLVRCCCWYAGIQVGFFYTATEATVLLSTGAFIELTSSDYQRSSNYLRRGDILVTKKKGHTLVVLSDGPKAYMWNSDLTIALQKFYGTYVDGEIWGQYTFCKKYLPAAGTGWKFGLSAKGSSLILAMQKDLKQKGFYRDTLDGIAGRNFVIALQSFLNTIITGEKLEVDGLMGAKTVKALWAYINREFEI